VLSADVKLEGWTFIALVYREGRASLYVDGKLSGVGTGSGNIIHPGLGAAASGEQYESYFEGNSFTPQLYREALNEEKIRGIFAQGLPAPALPSALSVRQDANGRVKVLCWQDGRYIFHRKTGAFVPIVAVGAGTRVVEGSWELQFPANRGAPPSLELPALLSLHLHPDLGVRHFSGTAVYKKKISWGGHGAGATPGKALFDAVDDLGHGSALDLDAGPVGKRRVFLDLGRVEVIAEVRLNGYELGILWKEPYRVEVTDTLRKGDNQLEVRVTNLWPNRLIGDEQLPPENEYSPFGPVLALPDWYVNNLPKSGKRVTFSVWHSCKKEEPLLASGLLGPVRILIAIQKELDV
jgi:hypothetical protein